MGQPSSSPSDPSSLATAAVTGLPATSANPSASYNEQLKQDFGKMIDELPLKPVQREYLRMRWLDQILWMEKRATESRDRHYQLRVTAILGGLLVPVLVGLTPVEGDKSTLNVFRYTTAGLGAIVAVASAIDQFFSYGDRWRNYRRSAELLKSQGWQFFQLSGPYSKSTNHETAFSMFAGQVEEVIQRDVEVYATTSQEKHKDKDGDGKPDVS
jgi:hypothetical protein